jgi:23S rRNA (cytidine1920-2'-O)/16S rRNA (cytidine1409-2'-O)-methyltransferase
MANFVSRAGKKLQFALAQFNISPKGLICADFGSSTGGFVDCLLQNGAKKVYSVDTAYGELAWKLRRDARVVVMERINAMHVVLPELVDLISIDVGWTKQKNILPNAFENLKRKGKIISLIKPHYEAEKGKLKDSEVNRIIESTRREIQKVGGKVEELIESPILGEKGKNREFLTLIGRLRV